ncbi:MAG: DUF975 family protein [Clostridiales bacterium]|nr:DUF975 family protein [Clostridiales bacterium]
MWTCSEIRRSARNRINASLSTTLFSSFVYLAILSALPILYSFVYMISSFTIIRGRSSDAVTAIYPLISMMGWLYNLAMIALTFFVFNLLLVGFVRFISTLKPEMNEGEKSVGNLFWAFREGRYSRILAGTAWKQLWLIIWNWITSLVYFIPVIVFFVALFLNPNFTKAFEENDPNTMDFWTTLFEGAVVALLIFGAVFLVCIIAQSIVLYNRMYAYIFTEYVLSEQPGLPTKSALEISKKMTAGIKLRMFLLDLSFIGWRILSLFTFGILNIWILPYRTAAFLEVYYRRKEELRPASVSSGTQIAPPQGNGEF